MWLLSQQTSNLHSISNSVRVISFHRFIEEKLNDNTHLRETKFQSNQILCVILFILFFDYENLQNWQTDFRICFTFVAIENAYMLMAFEIFIFIFIRQKYWRFSRIVFNVSVFPFFFFFYQCVFVCDMCLCSTQVFVVWIRQE